ncbi:ImmA/IrrE family metallo-endopeptidase [Kribbella soli]
MAIQLARMTRAQLARRRGEINIRDWREIGVSVERRAISSSGMLVRREMPLNVWVNAKDDWRRQRFTVGHEIAHYLLPSRSELAPQLLERLCDTFAAELLLPSAQVRGRLSPTGGLSTARDILELANDARINLSPVLSQLGRIAWDPRFGALLVTMEMGDLRVRAGAGPEIGSPPRNQRLSSLGRWRVLQIVDGALPHRSGIVDLDYRFIKPVKARENPRSGRLRGIARWDSIELGSRRAIVSLNFLNPPEMVFSNPTGIAPSA